MLGGPSNCEIPIANYRATRMVSLAVLDALESTKDVGVIRFDQYLCDPDRCITERDGTALYLDAGHLSADGSIYLAREAQLVERIHSMAR